MTAVMFDEFPQPFAEVLCHRTPLNSSVPYHVDTQGVSVGSLNWASMKPRGPRLSHGYHKEIINIREYLVRNSDWSTFLGG